MELWISALILAAALAGLVRLRAGGKKVKKVLTALAVLAAAAGVYLVLGLLLMGNRSSQPSDAATETAAAVPAETEAPAETPAETPPRPPLPEDYDLPVSRLPEALPDPHGIADLTYGEVPGFNRSEELSTYLLNRFLHGEFQLDFYLTRELCPSDGAGTSLVSDCVEAAQAYYPFAACSFYSLYPEEVGDPDRVLMHMDLRYENPAYDQEARAEALEYVLKHPVPEGGFRDASREKEYCLGIHDYLIHRISYDPIGYNPLEMLNSSQYDNKQEAYNVLVSEDTTAVCAAYARGFALIAQYAGIDCACVLGNEVTEPDLSSHLWNVVYPCDGSGPVLVDVTWDDPDLVDDHGNTLYGYGYFYLPLELDFEHTPQAEVERFLDSLHK